MYEPSFFRPVVLFPAQLFLFFFFSLGAPLFCFLSPSASPSTKRVGLFAIGTRFPSLSTEAFFLHFCQLSSLSLSLSLSLLYFLFGFLPGALFLTRFPGSLDLALPSQLSVSVSSVCSLFISSRSFPPFFSSFSFHPGHPHFSPHRSMIFLFGSSVPSVPRAARSLSSTLRIFRFCSPLNFLQKFRSAPAPSSPPRCCHVSFRFTRDFDSICTFTRISHCQSILFSYVHPCQRFCVSFPSPDVSVIRVTDEFP